MDNRSNENDFPISVDTSPMLNRAMICESAGNVACKREKSTSPVYQKRTSIECEKTFISTEGESVRKSNGDTPLTLESLCDVVHEEYINPEIIKVQPPKTITTEFIESEFETHSENEINNSNVFTYTKDQYLADFKQELKERGNSQVVESSATTVEITKEPNLLSEQDNIEIKENPILYLKPHPDSDPEHYPEPHPDPETNAGSDARPTNTAKPFDFSKCFRAYADYFESLRNNPDASVTIPNDYLYQESNSSPSANLNQHNQCIASTNCNSSDQSNSPPSTNLSQENQCTATTNLDILVQSNSPASTNLNQESQCTAKTNLDILDQSNPPPSTNLNQESQCTTKTNLDILDQSNSPPSTNLNQESQCTTKTNLDILDQSNSPPSSNLNQQNQRTTTTNLDSLDQSNASPSSNLNQQNQCTAATNVDSSDQASSSTSNNLNQSSSSTNFNSSGHLQQSFEEEVDTFENCDKVNTDFSSSDVKALNHTFEAKVNSLQDSSSSSSISTEAINTTLTQGSSLQDSSSNSNTEAVNTSEKDSPEYTKTDLLTIETKESLDQEFKSLDYNQVSSDEICIEENILTDPGKVDSEVPVELNEHSEDFVDALTSQEISEPVHDNLQTISHSSQQDSSANCSDQSIQNLDSNQSIEIKTVLELENNLEEKIVNTLNNDRNKTIVIQDKTEISTEICNNSAQSLEKDPEVDKSLSKSEENSHETATSPSEVHLNSSRKSPPIEFTQTMTDELLELRKENSELKLQLNAAQQAKASLELEIRQKEEVIIKTQAEALNTEQAYKIEIKQLKDNTELIDKSSNNKDLEQQLKETKEREAKALGELSQLKKDISNYEVILEDFDKAFNQKLAEYNKLKEEYDVTKRHFTNLELAFSDVHEKYEKTKECLLKMQHNQDSLEKSLLEAHRTHIGQEERYDSLKAHARSQLDKSNRELRQMREQYETEISLLKALVKRSEIKCKSLEAAIQQKEEENKQLSALCDEVTGKRF